MLLLLLLLFIIHKLRYYNFGLMCEATTFITSQVRIGYNTYSSIPLKRAKNEKRSKSEFEIDDTTPSARHHRRTMTTAEMTTRSTDITNNNRLQY